MSSKISWQDAKIDTQRGGRLQAYRREKPGICQVSEPEALAKNARPSLTLQALKLRDQHARMPGEIVNRRPQREIRNRRQLLARRLLLGGADFDDQVSARQQTRSAFRDQAIEDDETPRPALQCLVRLKLTHAD